MAVHYFIALELADETKQALAKIVPDRVKESFRLQTHPADYHITLAFLGAIDEPVLEKIEACLTESVPETGVFSYHLEEIGTFGLPHSPRILWIGPSMHPSMHSLHQSVSECVSQAGHRVDTRPFRPHVTVAKKWNAEKPFQLDVTLPEPVPAIAGAVVLYKITPDQQPKYTIRNRWLLS